METKKVEKNEVPIGELRIKENKVAQLVRDKDRLKEQLDAAMVRLDNMRHQYDIRIQDVKKKEEQALKPGDAKQEEELRITLQSIKEREYLEDTVRHNLLKVLTDEANKGAKKRKLQGEHVDEIKHGINCHTVKVRFLKPTRAIEDNLVNPIRSIYEQAFRITATTRFADIKKAVCMYWGYGESIKYGETMRLAHWDQMTLREDLLISKFFTDHQGATPEFIFFDADENEANLRALFQITADIEEVDKGQGEATKGNQDMKETGKKVEACLQNYPGLRDYIPARIETVEEGNIIRLNNRENSCCTFMMVIILFSLTLYVMFGRMEMKNAYWTQQSVNTHLMEEWSPKQDFYDIKRYQDVYLYLRIVIGSELFGKNKELRDLAMFTGSIRLRQVMTDDTSCEMEDDYDFHDDAE